MAGVTFSVTFDDDQALAGMERLQAALADTSGLQRVIGAYGVESTRRRFMEEAAPDGSKWKGLNPAYADLKGPGRNILYASGALMNSLNFRSGAGEVSWGSNRIYAAIHQFGGTIVPKNAKALTFLLGNPGALLTPVQLVRVKSVTIPARPYLGINLEDREEIEALGNDYLARAWGGN